MAFQHTFYAMREIPYMKCFSIHTSIITYITAYGTLEQQVQVMNMFSSGMEVRKQLLEEGGLATGGHTYRTLRHSYL
jgi:hypothetical protein